jgi:aconitate hydratase
MINGLSVLGWGVGGIEAEAAMLGQPVSMLIPEVVGVRLTGKLEEGLTATDLVLRVVEMLREHGVVGKFVEYFGEGLDHLSLEDQATLANMAPEYGATCGFFPIDEDTLSYMRATGRGDEAQLVEHYAKAQGLWREADVEPVFTDVLELDLGSIKAAISGPKRPQDRIDLEGAGDRIEEILQKDFGKSVDDLDDEAELPLELGGELCHGDIVIAAITSCTNTSNPSVLIAAGLVARKAREKGLHVKPWVKTSLAPGSQVVTDYLEKAGLMDDLAAMGFDLVGYGCTTCIGNSGPLDPNISKAIHDHDLVACSVLSGNRNFEGRISPDVKANFLASPPLVVAYALAGTMRIDLTSEMVGLGDDGQIVFLKDIWPTNKEIADLIRSSVTPEMFDQRYGDVFKGDEHWQGVKTGGGETYDWDMGSTYVKNPPYFAGMSMEPEAVKDIENARTIALFGDSITTDHISPAGAIKEDSPAGAYLTAHQVSAREFNSYGSRRGNHDVMMRGTFANIRIRNQLLPGSEGGVTRHMPSGDEMSIYDAAMRYMEEGVPLVVLTGKEYGTGSSRDWAAKGTRLLGIRAVIAESFERIHRSNLIGMGVLPLTFMENESVASLGLTGEEQISIENLKDLEPRSNIEAMVKKADGREQAITLRVRIDTEDELTYYRHGGILHFVLRQLAGAV